VPNLKSKPPGVYYVILVLDHLHKIAETNEGNNAIALKVRDLPRHAVLRFACSSRGV
jgi:hypothetical protein